MQTLLDFVDASFHQYLDTNTTTHLVVIQAKCLEGNINIKCWPAKHNIEIVARLSTNQNAAFLLEVWDCQLVCLSMIGKVGRGHVAFPNNIFAQHICPTLTNASQWGLNGVAVFNSGVSEPRSDFLLWPLTYDIALVGAWMIQLLNGLKSSSPHYQGGLHGEKWLSDWLVNFTRDGHWSIIWTLDTDTLIFAELKTEHLPPLDYHFLH